VLDNPDRAELVAQAEIARAQASAARQVYAETGRTEVEVSTAEDDKVCPICDAAAKLGAHPLGAEPLVPLHPPLPVRGAARAGRCVVSAPRIGEESESWRVGLCAYSDAPGEPHCTRDAAWHGVKMSEPEWVAMASCDGPCRSC